MKRTGLAFFLFFLLVTPSIAFTLKNYECFQFLLQDYSGSSHSKNLQHWCYAKIEDGTKDSLLVFNADDATPQPELSALIDNEGKVSHGYQLKGKHKIARTHIRYLNPLPVPLTFKEAKQLSKLKILKTFDSLFRRKLEEITNSFLETRSRLSVQKLSDRIEESRIPMEELPFNGYWWPHVNDSLAGTAYSPLGKYDKYVSIKNGTNPKSREWEIKHHSDKSVEWGGHCNGWVASSLLYDEPTEARWDPLTKQVFLLSDLKGILAESSFCVQSAFYGLRNNGTPGDDPQDISPDKFHKVITYYVGHLKKAVAFDYFPTPWVDNNVIAGYRFEIKRDGTDKTIFHVKALIYAHDYEKQRSEKVGAAPPRNFEYQYDLKVNEQDEIISGKWAKETINPDFLWVPLVNKKCGEENPNVEESVILEMLEKLPKAKVITVPLQVSVTGPLEKKKPIPLPNLEMLRGLNYKIFYKTKGLKKPAYLVSSYASDFYPNKNPPTTQRTDVIDSAAGEIVSRGQDIISLELINPNPVSTIEFENITFEKIEFLAGE